MNWVPGNAFIIKLVKHQFSRIHKFTRVEARRGKARYGVRITIKNRGRQRSTVFIASTRNNKPNETNPRGWVEKGRMN